VCGVDNTRQHAVDCTCAHCVVAVFQGWQLPPPGRFISHYISPPVRYYSSTRQKPEDSGFFSTLLSSMLERVLLHYTTACLTMLLRCALPKTTTHRQGGGKIRSIARSTAVVPPRLTPRTHRPPTGAGDAEHLQSRKPLTSLCRHLRCHPCATASAWRVSPFMLLLERKGGGWVKLRRQYHTAALSLCCPN